MSHPYALWFIAGLATGHFRILPWLRDWGLYLYARARGGQWYPKLQRCRGCGKHGHVMADRSDVLEAGLADDGGTRCPSCAKGARR